MQFTSWTWEEVTPLRARRDTYRYALLKTLCCPSVGWQLVPLVSKAAPKRRLSASSAPRVPLFPPCSLRGAFFELASLRDACSSPADADPEAWLRPKANFTASSRQQRRAGNLFFGWSLLERDEPVHSVGRSDDRCRLCFGCCVADSRLYAIGGCTDTTTLGHTDQVEVYGFEKGARAKGPSLPLKLHSFGCCSSGPEW